MAFTSGKKLGPYEIVSALGAGGMGEVYRARDTRLDRTVAIKILPADSSEKGGPFLHSIIPTFARCTTSATRTGSTIWSWSFSKGRLWPTA
jgi:serine/threonine protein kinase